MESCSVTTLEADVHTERLLDMDRLIRVPLSTLIVVVFEVASGGYSFVPLAGIVEEFVDGGVALVAVFVVIR